MKCEFCGIEHNGSYGSGRFCSKRCRMRFLNSKARKSEKWKISHVKACLSNRKKDGWVCSFCGNKFDTRKEMSLHKKSIHNNVQYMCKYCGKKYEHVYQVAAHTARCKKNPNYSCTMSKQIERLIKTAKLGRSEEQRKKISESMKKFFSEHPESASYKYNHYSKGSWAEDYFRDLFLTEKIIDWEQQFRVDRYRLDFAFVKDFVDFEVDGHQHKFDKRIVQHDIERTKNLQNKGWKVVRIMWSDWKQMSTEQKHKWLEDNLYCLLGQFK